MGARDTSRVCMGLHELSWGIHGNTMAMPWVFMAPTAVACNKTCQGIAMKMTHSSAIGGLMALVWDCHRHGISLLTLKLILTLTLRPWECAFVVGCGACRGTCHGTAMGLYGHAMAVPWLFHARR